MTVQGTGFSMTLATGRQAFCAAIVFVSNYVIALPIAVTLMFVTHLELAGIMHLFAHTHTRYCYAIFSAIFSEYNFHRNAML